MFNRNQAAHYLAAMIDGEGWVGEPKGVSNRAIRIANTDEALVAAITECCEVLGLHYTVQHIKKRRENWAAGWFVDITGIESYRIVQAEVPVRAPKKMDRIERTILSYRRPPLDIERCRELYATGMTQKEVADAMGVSKQKVINAMRKHNVPRRLGSDRADSVWRSRRKVTVSSTDPDDQ